MRRLDYEEHHVRVSAPTARPERGSTKEPDAPSRTIGHSPVRP